MRAVVVGPVFAIGAIGAATSCGGHERAASRGSCAASGPGAGPSCGVDHSDDCCATTLVSGGQATLAFWSDDFGDGPEQPTVSSFALDKYEVSVGRFRAFAAALDDWRPAVGAGGHPRVPGSGWQSGWPLAASASDFRAEVASCAGTWTDAPADHEDLPMTCLTWYELFAFCAWDGGRLPTMTERAYTEAGGSEGRAFPWSSPPDAGTVDPTLAVYADQDGAPFEVPAPVGSKPLGAGRWGALDLGGNVEEWGLDAFPPVVYPTPARGCVDCAVLPADGGPRVVQGGSYLSVGIDLSSSRIGGADPLERSPARGGRCAHSLATTEFTGGLVGPTDCTPPPADGGTGCTGCIAGAVSATFTCRTQMLENLPPLSETLAIGPVSASQDLSNSGFSFVPPGQNQFQVGSYGASDLDGDSQLLVEGPGIVGAYLASGASMDQVQLVLTNVDHPTNGTATSTHGTLDAHLTWTGYAGQDAVVHVRF